MANIARLKTWNLNETLTSADLNAEFDNILSGTNNGSLDSDNIDQTDTYTWSGNHTFNSLVTHGANLTVGVDDLGHDVQFFGATSGAHLLWDESADTLKLVGGAATDMQGTLTVGVNDTGYDVQLFGATAGAHLLWDESADTLKLVGGAATNMQGTLTVGVDDTGYDVQLFGATSGAYALWDESADELKLVNATISIDGSQVTAGGVSLSGSTNNTIATVTGADALAGEANLTFDGSTLAVTGAQTLSGDLTINTSSLFVDASTSDVGIGTATPASFMTAANGNGLVIYNPDGAGSTHAAELVLATANTSTQAVISFNDGVDTSPNGSILYDLNGTGFYFKAGSNTTRMTLTEAGALDVTGALSKGSGSFRIRHPLPEKSGYDLVHSFIEGPQADLIYRGVVNLVNGEASVNIDTAGRMTEGTFVALCGNVQSFTSNESNDDCVRGSVSGNILTITSSNAASTASISWMVIGERIDEHMLDTEWTDVNGRVITEPLAKVEPDWSAQVV
jgi:hypothetical protein